MDEMLADVWIAGCAHRLQQGSHLVQALASLDELTTGPAFDAADVCTALKLGEGDVLVCAESSEVGSPLRATNQVVLALPSGVRDLNRARAIVAAVSTRSPAGQRQVLGAVLAMLRSHSPSDVNVIGGAVTRPSMISEVSVRLWVRTGSSGA